MDTFGIIGLRRFFPILPIKRIDVVFCYYYYNYAFTWWWNDTFYRRLGWWNTWRVIIHTVHTWFCDQQPVKCTYPMGLACVLLVDFSPLIYFTFYCVWTEQNGIILLVKHNCTLIRAIFIDKAQNCISKNNKRSPWRRFFRTNDILLFNFILERTIPM